MRAGKARAQKPTWMKTLLSVCVVRATGSRPYLFAETTYSRPCEPRRAHVLPRWGASKPSPDVGATSWTPTIKAGVSQTVRINSRRRPHPQGVQCLRPPAEAQASRVGGSRHEWRFSVCVVLATGSSPYLFAETTHAHPCKPRQAHVLARWGAPKPSPDVGATPWTLTINAGVSQTGRISPKIGRAHV